MNAGVDEGQLLPSSGISVEGRNADVVVELQPIVYSQAKQPASRVTALLPEAYRASSGSFLKYVGLGLGGFFVLALIFAAPGSPLRPTVILGTATGEMQGANLAAEAPGAAQKARALAQVEIEKNQANLLSQLEYDKQRLEIEKQAIIAKADADAAAQIAVQQEVAAINTKTVELTAKIKACGRLQAEISEYRAGIGVNLLDMFSPELRRAADIMAMKPKIEEFERCKADLAVMAANAGVSVETFQE